MTLHLYNQKDVRAVREEILAAQGTDDLLTGFHLELKDAVLDHNHDTQKVRAVIHRQVNAALGKIENAYRRYIRPIYGEKYEIQTWLRDCSEYLGIEDENIYHPRWLKKSLTLFNTLNSAQKTFVLHQFGIDKSMKNDKERKDAFDKLIKSKIVTFDEVKEAIEYSKEKIRKC